MGSMVEWIWLKSEIVSDKVKPQNSSIIEQSNKGTENIYLFIQQMFIESLVCTRYYTKH